VDKKSENTTAEQTSKHKNPKLESNPRPLAPQSDA